MTYQELTGGCVLGNLNGTEYKLSKIVKASNSETYPFSFRLWTSGIKNQQSKNSCVAHALTTMKEIQDYYDTKEQRHYSEGWVYLNRKQDQYKGEGMYIKEALSNLQEFGVIPYSMFSDNLEWDEGILSSWNLQKDETLKEEAYKHRIANYAIADSTVEIKESLYKRHTPVVIAINVYGSFYQTGNDGIVKLPNITKEEMYGGHAMVIIGWTNINGKEYWVVQNSWGKEWGDNGVCYLNIEKFPIAEQWTTIDIEDYPCNLTDIQGRWSEKYIEGCVRAGLINGYEDGSFCPTNPITREEIAAIIYKIVNRN